MIDLHRFGPAVLLLLATLACALPWAVAPEFRLVLPLLPYVVIHRCVERSGEAMPDWLVFLAGFAMDVVGQGPLGYWSLIYLCGYTIVRSVTADRAHGFASSAALFSVTIVSLSLMQWSLASIYYMRAADISPIATSAVFALVAYLVLYLLLPVHSTLHVRTNGRLERGR